MSDELTIPYALTVYAAIDGMPPGERFLGIYLIRDGIPMIIYGKDEADVRAKAAARNKADIEAMVRQLGGIEAAKAKRAEAVARRAAARQKQQSEVTV
jgi:hypothetical protein